MFKDIRNNKLGLLAAVSLSIFSMNTVCATDIDDSKKDPVERIIDSIEQVDLKMERDLKNLKDQNIQNHIQPVIPRVVIIAGQSGQAKSTLGNFLYGKPLKTKMDTGKVIVDVDGPPIQGMEIGHEGSQTSLPHYWFDATNNVAFYDSPGLLASEGETENIKNLYALYKLFRSFPSVKFMFVAREPYIQDLQRLGGFRDVLNTMGKFFKNNIKDLADGSCLVVTQQVDLTTDQDVLSIFNQTSLKPGNLSTEAVGILKDLKKISFFPKAQKDTKDPYTYKPFLELVDTKNPTTVTEGKRIQKEIFDTLNKTTFIDTTIVSPTMALSSEAQLFSIKLADKIRDETIVLISDIITPEIFKYCETEILKNSGGTFNLGTLRSSFKTLGDLLKGINSQQISIFKQDVQNIFQRCGLNKDYLTKKIDYISFLTEINPTLTLPLDAWVRAFSKAQSDIEMLGEIPRELYHNHDGHLTFDGILVGASDVNKAFSQHPLPSRVDVYALNTLWIDESITKPGLSFSFLAPRWNVTSPQIINLNGGDNITTVRDGYDGSRAQDRNGGDGEPGMSGGNGGHFYGRANDCINPQHLKITADGGNGGNGGSGGNGGNGTNGSDGNSNGTLIDHFEINDKTQNVINIHLKHSKYSVLLNHLLEYHERSYNDSWTHNTLINVNLYNFGNSGSEGEIGGNGGRGGSKGLGGKEGSIRLVGSIDFDLFIKATNVGKSGNDGLHGRPGQGGMYGGDCRGQKISGTIGLCEWLHRGWGWGDPSRQRYESVDNIWIEPFTIVPSSNRAASGQAPDPTSFNTNMQQTPPDNPSPFDDQKGDLKVKLKEKYDELYSKDYKGNHFTKTLQ